jgi:hypothetical protein
MDKFKQFFTVKKIIWATIISFAIKYLFWIPIIFVGLGIGSDRLVKILLLIFKVVAFPSLIFQEYTDYSFSLMGMFWEIIYIYILIIILTILFRQFKQQKNSIQV